MQEYNYWMDTLSKFKTRICPFCGAEMGARNVAPHNHVLFMCSECVLAVDLNYDETVKKIGKIGNIRLRGGKNI